MRQFCVVLMLLWNIFHLLVPLFSITVNPQCNYEQNMIVGETYYINSPGYPQNYVGAASCRWIGTSLENTKIVINCNIEIPQSDNCYTDRFAVSLTGDPYFNDAHNYCGGGQLTLTSEKNALSIGLFSSSLSTGGRFACSLRAIQSNSPTTEQPVSCDCGWRRQMKIAGGEEAGVNEFPAMALLWNIQNRHGNGGATIISERYALTAAHIITDIDISILYLVAGEHNISSTTDTPYTAAYTLIQAIPHPDYDYQTNYNDIAIIKTGQPIQFSPFVGPICLPFRYTSDSFVNQSVIALGWGSMEFLAVNNPDSLQKVALNVISNTECNQRMSGTIILSQICTYGDHKDACDGDSGGPILYQDRYTRHLELVGIISYGYACATQRPGVNTRVTAFLDWILNTTPDAVYCVR